jgi:hypothetical protein
MRPTSKVLSTRQLRQRNLAHQRLLLPQRIDLLIIPACTLRAKAEIEVQDHCCKKQAQLVPGKILRECRVSIAVPWSSEVERH